MALFQPRLIGNTCLYIHFCKTEKIKSSQVELYCHSAACGDIQWNEMSCLTGPRCYINTDIQQWSKRHKSTVFGTWSSRCVWTRRHLPSFLSKNVPICTIHCSFQLKSTLEAVKLWQLLFLFTRSMTYRNSFDYFLTVTCRMVCYDF